MNDMDARKVILDTWRGRVTVSDDASKKWRQRKYWNVRAASINRLKTLCQMSYLGKGVYFGVVPRGSKDD